MTSKGQREVALLRRLFIAFTATASVAEYSAHIKQLLGRLGSEAVLPFLSWFVRDAQRANENTRAHSLYIGASMLQGQKSSTATRTEALGRVAQALPSVLAALHDEETLVRHAAVTWLRAAAALGKDEDGKIKWPKEPLLGLVAAGDLVGFLSALVSCSDELLSDSAHLPTFLESALLLEKMDTNDEDENADDKLSHLLSEASKESMQELLIRQTVQLRTEDLMSQVLLLEDLHHAARPKVVLPLAQELLASLSTLSLSDKGRGEEAAKEAAADPAKHALQLRLVRIAVRLSYGNGIDVAMSSAGKKAPKLMAPLVDSIHAEAQDASARHAHAAADGNSASSAAATRGSGKDRTSRGIWLETLIKSVSAPLFQSLDDKACQQVFADLCSIAGKSQANLSKAARERLRRLPLSVDHLEKLFASLCNQLEEANAVEQKAGKRGKNKAERPSNDASAVLPAVAEALVVLDTLQAHEDPAHVLELMPRLFKVLASVNESRPATLGAEDGDESLTQSLLGAILALLQASRETTAASGKANKKDKEHGVDMQALVMCIRSAISPQTRHEALNCLVELARSHPKSVLSHVMAVFTFLGESGLVHDDQYSFHVIEQTIKSIIPPLVENGMQPIALLRVFVNSLPSIPAHRRLRLFTTLLMLFEDDNILQVFLTLLLAKVGADKEAEMISFGILICGQFALEKQLSSMLLVLETLAAVPTSSNGLKACENTAFSAAGGSVEELQRMQQRLIQVFNGTLGGRSFAGLLQALPAQEEGGAQELLLTLFEKVLVLQQRISQVGFFLVYVCLPRATLHQKFLGCGFLTPMPLFCLICTIISNKMGMLDQYQNTFQVRGARRQNALAHSCNCALKRSVAARPAARSFLVARFDSRCVPRRF